MHFRILLTVLAVSALAVPAVQAQTGRTLEDRARVEMPRPGRVSMIGLRVSDVTAEDVKALKLAKQEGAVVESINPSSPAATAGFREKDVIVQFDGERVRSASHLTRLVGETPAGREVSVVVMRDGRSTDLRVRPEAGNNSWFDPRFGGTIDLDTEEWRERVEKAGRAARELGRNLPEAIASNRARLGVTVQELSSELADYFGVKSGVLVASVAPDSPAAKAGLKAGDVITAVNGKSIATSRELVSSLPTGESTQEAALTVFRDKRQLTMKATLVRSSQKGARV